MRKNLDTEIVGEKFYIELNSYVEQVEIKRYHKIWNHTQSIMIL